MFIGHFGIAFAAKPLAPALSLGSLFLAAQFLDLLWPTLLLLGVEQVRVVPGATAVTPLIFEHYPISHSLLAVTGWALLVGAAYYQLRKKALAALVVGGLVLSHWLLDAVVHHPDLPLFPGSETLVGLSAWNSLPATLAIELAVFALGIWLYARSTSPADGLGRWGLAGLAVFLSAVYAGNLLGAPPPSAEAIAWVGQMQWLLVLWGYWLDKHRQSVPHPGGAVA